MTRKPVQAFFDTLSNLASMVGTSRDKSTHWVYSYTPMDQNALEQFYVGDWIARKIVEIPAYDMTREWRDWQTDQSERMYEVERELHVQQKVFEAKTDARLYGGAVIYLGLPDQDPSTPLELDNVRRDSLKYLHVFNHFDLTAEEKVITDINDPAFGLSATYRINAVKAITPEQRLLVHRSRFVFFKGNKIPKGIADATRYWGMPVLESIKQAVMNVSTTAANASALTEEALVDVITIPDLEDHLTTAKATERLVARFEIAARLKSMLRTLLLGGEETFERKQITFGELSNLIRTHLDLAAGAGDIPVTRLFGQSPAGLNSTGESDIRNYYDGLGGQQKTQLTPEMEVLDECLIRSALGTRPKEVAFEWNPLWQMTEAEKATIGKTKADTAKVWIDTGLLLDVELRPSVIQMLVDDGTYPSLDEHTVDDDEFEEAKEPELLPEPGNENEEQPNARMRFTAGDTTTRSLVVVRPVANANEIIAWAKKQNIPGLVDAGSLHVTIAYSRAAVDWFKASGWSTSKKVEIAEGGPRAMERFGDNIVLLFKSEDLEWRHQEFKSLGASWDYPEYNPHITIGVTSDQNVDLAAIEPYQGRIVLGPEEWDEVKEPTQEAAE